MNKELIIPQYSIMELVVGEKEFVWGEGKKRGSLFFYIDDKNLEKKTKRIVLIRSHLLPVKNIFFYFSVIFPFFFSLLP